MKVEFSTTSKGVEVANMLIARAIESIEKTPQLMDVFNLSKTDLEAAKKFRKSLLDSFLKK